MRNTVRNTVAWVGFVVSFCLLFFQGFAFPSIPAFADCILRILAALCLQAVFLINFRKTCLRVIPFVLSILLSLWGGWLFLTSDAWQNATVHGYLTNYCSPALGCMIMCLISKLKK